MTESPGRVLLTGASGKLGSYVLRELCSREVPVVAWSARSNVELFGCRCRRVDLRQTDEVVTAYREASPDLVIHTAALSGVGDCYRDPTRARQINTSATRLLADLAARHEARFIYTSTDLVFDGRKTWYVETDCLRPLSIYGNTKAAAERAVLHYPRHLVLRVALLFGPSLNDRFSFFDQQIQAIRSGESCVLFEDEWRTPVSFQTAARAILTAAASDVSGLLHLGGPERMSRLEMGQRLARAIGKSDAPLEAAKRDDFASDEPRPRDTSLCGDRWTELFPDFHRPTYEEELMEMSVGDVSR